MGKMAYIIEILKTIAWPIAIVWIAIIVYKILSNKSIREFMKSRKIKTPGLEIAPAYPEGIKEEKEKEKLSVTTEISKEITHKKQLIDMLFDKEVSKLEFIKELRNEFLPEFPNEEEKCSKEIFWMGFLQKIKKVSILQEAKDITTNKYPSNPKAWIFLGNVLLKAKQDTESKIAFEKAVKLAEEQEKEKMVLEATLGLFHFFETDELFKQVKFFFERLKLPESKGFLLKGLGDILHKRNEEQQKKISLWKTSLKFLPDDTELLFSIAYAISDEQPKLKAYYYSRLLKIQPNSSSAINNLGICLGKIGYPSEKIKHWFTAWEEYNSSFSAGNLIYELTSMGFWEWVEKLIDAVREKIKKPDETFINAEDNFIRKKVEVQKKLETLWEEIDKLGKKDINSIDAEQVLEFQLENTYKLEP